MSIYTKTGDRGETSLANGNRVAKTDPRIEAYGTVDELNSQIGILRTELSHSEAAVEGIASSQQEQDIQLHWVQNKLFNLGASLSEAPGEWLTPEDTALLEEWIDRIQSKLPRQRGFVLPAGNRATVTAHLARTVCRRAERRMIESNASSIACQFINRLSDYLFVLARFITTSTGAEESLWEKDFRVEKSSEQARFV